MDLIFGRSTIGWSTQTTQSLLFSGSLHRFRESGGRQRCANREFRQIAFGGLQPSQAKEEIGAVVLTAEALAARSAKYSPSERCPCRGATHSIVLTDAPNMHSA